MTDKSEKSEMINILKKAAFLLIFPLMYFGSNQFIKFADNRTFFHKYADKLVKDERSNTLVLTKNDFFEIKETEGPSRYSDLLENSEAIINPFTKDTIVMDTKIPAHHLTTGFWMN